MKVNIAALTDREAVDLLAAMTTLLSERDLHKTLSICLKNCLTTDQRLALAHELLRSCA